jgi:hypothetical protein
MRPSLRAKSRRFTSSSTSFRMDFSITIAVLRLAPAPEALITTRSGRFSIRKRLMRSSFWFIACVGSKS